MNTETLALVSASLFILFFVYRAIILRAAARPDDLESRAKIARRLDLYAGAFRKGRIH